MEVRRPGFDPWVGEFALWVWLLRQDARQEMGTGRPGVLRFMGSQRVGHD